MLYALSLRHVAGLIFAFIVGSVVVAPQLAFIIDEGERYQGLYMMMSTESEWYYLARMHEFYDEGRIGNPYLLEHKFHGPIFISPGAETLLAIPGKLLDISVPTINLIYKFLLPAITFFLLYLFIYRLTSSVAWSVTGGLFFLLGSTWLYANNLTHFLRGDSWFFREFVYNRAVHPQFDGVLFFTYLHVLLSALRRSSIAWYTLLGALLGLSFYTYFYSFTFFFALNVVTMCVWYFIGKKQEVLHIGAATLGGFLIGFPAILAIFGAMNHPDYAQITAYSISHGRFAEISKNGLLVSALLLMVALKARMLGIFEVYRERVLLLVALLVTTFLVVNQQLFTGLSLHSGHYHHNFNIPIFIIVLMCLASAVADHLMTIRSSFTRIARALPTVATLIFIITALIIQYHSYSQNAPEAREDQRYVAAFSWLDENSPKDSVVMANVRISELIPIFTSNNVMWAPDALNYLMPPERVRFTPERLLHSDDFFSDIRQFRVDYILWDKRSDPDWNIDRYGLSVVFSGEDLVMYQLPS